ncbi:hypothetical protein GCM10010401_14630 [Rarobacter faecitabidus]|uniref:Uncharacterized protein n=1 Tax=Rarobacter faecitabidus TaxID=13243 RepID=A0A542ZE02_RARFA|nr:hypothetical protein [Rarobacter faecitabidus]TQL58490.1 hypothetical protein FB461_1904 [Rarobacter faecitabidus]
MQNDPVYRRRRAVALVIVIALLVLIIWGISAIVTAIRGSGDEAAPSRQAASPSQSGEQTPGAPAECAADDIELSVSAANATYSLGGEVDFAVGISSKSKSPCLVNGSDASRVLTIRSGNDAIWSSGDCADDAARDLLMSEGSKDSQTITWKMTRSAPGCEKVKGKLRAGTYRAQVQLGKAKSEGFIFTLQ